MVDGSSDEDSCPERADAQVEYVSVDEDASGQRLDNFLSGHLRGVPRARLYRALRKGEVRVNRGRVRADYRLVAGDRIRIPPLHRLAPTQTEPVPKGRLQQVATAIVYEDADLLAVDKPAGLAVHGGSGLNYGLIECLRQLRPNGGYLELVHRLDRDTSGLVLIAKRARVLRELHRQLREKHIDKRYVALVAGRWPRHVQQVDAPLEKNVLSSGERMVRVSAQGKRAQTRFRVLERLPAATLVEAAPITGRTHQIRVHALHAGCPILGDTKYAHDEAVSLAGQIGLRRLFLHAEKLSFTLPDAAPLELQAALEHNLEVALNKIRN